MRWLVGGALLIWGGVSGADAQPSLRALLSAHRCDVIDRLARIHAGDRTTSRDRFITLSPRGRPDAYVQCIFFAADTAMRCEAASGAYAQKPGEGRPLAPPGDPAALAALGFATTRPGGNHTRDVILGDPADLGGVADLMLTALHDAFGVRVPTSLVVRAPHARRRRPIPDACLAEGVS